MPPYHSMTHNVDRESLEYLLAYPEMPPEFFTPVAIKQEPENDTAPSNSIKHDQGLEHRAIKQEDGHIKIEDAEIKDETTAIKQEIKQDLATLEHLMSTYRPYGATPDAEGITLSCRFCNFTYRSWRELWAHWTIQLGVETTRCMVCNFRYSITRRRRSMLLARHMKMP